MSETVEETPSRIKRLGQILIKSIIERVKGRDVRRQLDFLLNPKTIETSSRLSKNEIIAINQADWLGRHFYRFRPLREFWVGIDETRKGLFVRGRGGGFARWVISDRGLGRTESINFIGASREEKIISPILSMMRGEKEGEKK